MDEFDEDSPATVPAPLPEAERLQIQQIRELELEELEVEEVDGGGNSDDDPSDPLNLLGHRGAVASGEITFDTCLASLHTYLGEVEDTHSRLNCLDSGGTVTLPLLYLEGVVLFPEATLPLRVIQPSYIAAVRRALDQVDSPYTIGVARVYRDVDDGNIKLSNIGTTAEIKQYRVLEDGSLNVVTRGRQRFSIRRCWVDVEGMPCGEIQIIEEDFPLKTPRDALGTSPLYNHLRNHSFSYSRFLNSSHCSVGRYGQEDNDSDNLSEESFENELSPLEVKMHHSAIHSCYGYDTADESMSSDEDKFVNTSELQWGIVHSDNYLGLLASDMGSDRRNKTFGKRSRTAGGKFSDNSTSNRQHGGERWKLNILRRASRAYCPYWAYRLHDSYCLSQRVADLWKKIVGSPSMDDLVNKPDLLSFYVASKIPVSASTRQELLEINGISYRLRREIELLESFDQIRCKHCQSVIAKRRDMLVMSSEGPLGAYVNPHGFVHEIMTFYRATGLALMGRPSKEYSWFPGYAWTITNCAACEVHMGWLFTRVDKILKPRLFWGIRSSQVADDTG